MEKRFGDYRIRPRERELVGPEGVIELSSRSFDLLEVLLGQPNQLLDKAALFDAVWPGVVVEENTLQVHMSALRKALGPGFVATVHGRGYKYVGPEPVEDEDTLRRRPAGTAGNIGRYRADCVAREVEIEAVSRLLDQHRLVSILGPGGVGKTTLAVAVAETLGTVDGGVWMVDLASLSSGEFIESVLIQTLAVPFRAGSRSLESIVEYLRPSEAVLIFDNCEHVRGAAARVIRTLLAEVPNIRILATSQVPLALPEEYVFKLLPFAVTAEGELADAASAKFLAYCYEAFGERLSPAELPIVARLCRRLDGVALALKMAAARAATVGIETVDRQLEQRLASLEADWDPALPRHRSLAASLAWSYDLLEADDQRTLRALGVFQGSFSISAANAVAGEGAETRVAELVRRSLVVRDGQDRARYRLLDSTRHFALDKLAEAGEDVATRDRHAAYIRELFADSVLRWEALPDERWDQIYRPDGDNLRAALAWTKTRADWPTYVEIAAGSYRYFMEGQLGAEGLATIEAGMSLVGAVPPETAARLQLALGEIGRYNAMDVRAYQGLEPALAYFRSSDDRLRYTQALVLTAWITIFFHHQGDAEPLVAELETLIADMPPSKVKSWALVAIGTQMWTRGDVTAGLARAEAGLAMHLDTGNPKGRFRSVMNLAEMLHKGGDTERPLSLSEQILPELRAAGRSLQLGFQLNNIAAYRLSLGDAEGAAAPLFEAAEIVPRDGGQWHWCLLQNAAELLATRGAYDVAALLLGFADKSFESWIDGRQATEEMQRNRLAATLEAALSRRERDRLMQQGRALTLFEADHLAGFIKTERPRLKL